MADFPCCARQTACNCAFFPFVLRAHRVLTDDARGIRVRGAVGPAIMFYAAPAEDDNRTVDGDGRCDNRLCSSSTTSSKWSSNELGSIIQPNDAISWPCDA